MAGFRSVSVVVPVFNEEVILRQTVQHLLAGLAALDVDGYEVILSENGSTDRTRDIAMQLAEDRPHLRLLTMDEPDYGAAMRAGFMAARGDAIVSFDADYYDFDFLSEALASTGDIVVGCKGHTDSSDARSPLRRLASMLFAWLTRTALGVEVRETHGIKLFRASVVRRLLPRTRADKDLFDTELLARAELDGFIIDEVPVTVRELRESRSGILSRVPRTLAGLLEMRSRFREDYAVGATRAGQVAGEALEPAA